MLNSLPCFVVGNRCNSKPPQSKSALPPLAAANLWCGARNLEVFTTLQKVWRKLAEQLALKPQQLELKMRQQQQQLLLL
jgi:hypothetical protein